MWARLSKVICPRLLMAPVSTQWKSMFHASVRELQRLMHTMAGHKIIRNAASWSDMRRVAKARMQYRWR